MSPSAKVVSRSSAQTVSGPGSGKRSELGILFGVIEKIKQTYGVAEYAISPTSLEQIFNNFVTGRMDPGVKKDGLSGGVPMAVEEGDIRIRERGGVEPADEPVEAEGSEKPKSKSSAESLVDQPDGGAGADADNRPSQAV